MNWIRIVNWLVINHFSSIIKLYVFHISQCCHVTRTDESFGKLYENHFLFTHQMCFCLFLLFLLFVLFNFLGDLSLRFSYELPHWPAVWDAGHKWMLYKKNKSNMIRNQVFVYILTASIEHMLNSTFTCCNKSPSSMKQRLGKCLTTNPSDFQIYWEIVYSLHKTEWNTHIQQTHIKQYSYFKLFVLYFSICK